MSDFEELECKHCQAKTNVFYKDNGAPFNQIFLCQSCKEIEEKSESFDDDE